MAKILMPKATAVWLLENTSLTFKQISDFCELHMLEIESIANGEVVNKMPGINPINNKILTIDEIRSIRDDNNNTQYPLGTLNNTRLNGDLSPTIVTSEQFKTTPAFFKGIDTTSSAVVPPQSGPVPGTVKDGTEIPAVPFISLSNIQRNDSDKLVNINNCVMD